MSYYDSIAPGYNELHQEEQMKKIVRILEQLQGETVSNPLLDVGCGTGFSLDVFHEKLQISCYGIEPSAGMIAQYGGEQHIQQAAAENIPFPDKQFGIVISLTAIQNFVDVPQGVEEIIRVAKDDAHIVISCLKKSNKLRSITEVVSESLIVENVVEEEKDLIFFCKKREAYK